MEQEGRRVLQVLGRSAGGIARHVAQITAELDRERDVNVDIAGPPDLPVPMPVPVRPVTIPEGAVAGHLSAVRRLTALISEVRYDVVHAHGLRATIDAGLAGRRTGVPVISTIHNLVRPEVAGTMTSFVYRWAEPAAMRLSAHTFAVSEDIATRLRAVGPRDRVEVLYLGVGAPPEVRRDAAEVRAGLGVAGAQRLIVTASRLQPQKALDVMLHALARLPPSVSLAVLGEGPLEGRLRELAESLRITSRVHFLGFRDDLADHIAAADVFCLSSSWEGIPLAAQEAMLLGTPVVATDVGGMRELIEDGRTGLLVGRGDAPGLARAIQSVLGSDELRARLADAARRDLPQRFSTERMLDRLHAAYSGAGIALDA